MIKRSDKIKIAAKRIIDTIRDFSFGTPEKVFLDVGANTGGSSIGKRKKYIVYAFEPTPHLVEALREKTRKFPTYHVIPKAVSNKKGVMKFNIAGRADWGVSSLLDFKDGLEKTWKGRKDFVVTDSTDVEVITLKDFVEENSITKIDYLHCDAQGCDLEVLMGLGKYLHRVGGGLWKLREIMRLNYTRIRSLSWMTA